MLRKPTNDIFIHEYPSGYHHIYATNNLSLSMSKNDLDKYPLRGKTFNIDSDGVSENQMQIYIYVKSVKLKPRPDIKIQTF